MRGGYEKGGYTESVKWGGKFVCHSFLPPPPKKKKYINKLVQKKKILINWFKKKIEPKVAFEPQHLHYRSVRIIELGIVSILVSWGLSELSVIERCQ